MLQREFGLDPDLPFAQQQFARYPHTVAELEPFLTNLCRYRIEHQSLLFSGVMLQVAASFGEEPPWPMIGHAILDGWAAFPATCGFIYEAAKESPNESLAVAASVTLAGWGLTQLVTDPH